MKTNQEKAGMPILIHNQVDFRTRNTAKDKERHYIIFKKVLM